MVTMFDLERFIDDLKYKDYFEGLYLSGSRNLDLFLCKIYYNKKPEWLNKYLISYKYNDPCFFYFKEDLENFTDNDILYEGFLMIDLF